VLLTEPKKKVLAECSKKKMKWAELKRALSITDRALNKHLKQLVEAGFLEKDGKRYETTFLGFAHYSADKPYLMGALEKKVKKEIERVGLASNFMDGMSPAQKLVLGFTAALLGSKHALIKNKKIRQEVGELKKDLTKNINIAVSPQHVRKENVEGFVETLWKALNVLTRDPEFRKKAIRDGKLQVTITLDMDKMVKEFHPAVLNAALYWLFS
jgi:predicted DNA-binding transcriptional regulator